MRKIDVIIPTKDNVENLVSCLTSINNAVKDAKKLKVNVLVIDNRSSKTSRREFLDKVMKYDIFKNIIISPTFLGKSYEFPKLINIGIDISNRKKTKSEFISIINENVQIEETWFDSLLGEFDENEKLECVSSSLKSSNKKINLEACIIKLSSMKKLDENLISSFGIEDILASNFSDDQLLLSNKSIISYESEIDESLLNATKLNIDIKNSFGKKAYVLYTFIGENDKVPTLTNFDSKFEYVCFTTRKNFSIDLNWKIIDITEIKNALKLSEFKMKEYLKLHPHFFFSKMTSSIWVDFEKINDILTKDQTEILFKIKKGTFLLCPESSTCDCSYKLLLSLGKLKKISPKTSNEILQLYRWFNLKPECGMIDTSIMVMKHNNERFINTMNRVWGYVNKINVKSELFINMILFINRFNYSYIPSKLFFGKYFKLMETK